MSKTPRTITWGYTSPDKRPGTVMQTRRPTRPPVKHTHSTPAFHTTSETHNLPHTIARILARTHQIRPGSWAGSTELASNRIRSASGSTLSQHTNDQRAEVAQSMRHRLAEPPPRANHASSMPSSVPVERRASRLIQLEICVPLQPRTENEKRRSNPP